MRVPALTRRTIYLIVVGALFATCLLVAVGGSHPVACGLCHKAQTAALTTSPHESVHCYACHASDALDIARIKYDEVTRMYPRFLFGERDTFPGTRITREACVRCHGNISEATVGGAISIDHKSCAPPPERCDSCHSEDAHPGAVRWVRAPDMQQCITCHDTNSGPTDCDTCHEENPNDIHSAWRPFESVHRDTESAAHALGDPDSCTTCHEENDCAECHGIPLPHQYGYLLSHGQETLESRETCDECHDSPGWCESCHGIGMPHPNDILATHANLVDAEGADVCEHCHLPSECERCHGAHVHPETTDGSMYEELPQVGDGS